MKFKDFGFHPSLLEGIETLGFENATPIQEQAIPVIMQGKDLIASAQTGTGKTAAYLLPLIHKIISSQQPSGIKTLVIVPTRELAVQIDQQLEGLSYFTSVSSVPVYGGTDGNAFSFEKSALTDGADFIVGTPGRLIAHLNMGYVKMETLKYLVLDEADRMLDMGFYDDIMKIISFLPEHRQNLLFSATMPPKIKSLAKKALNHPAEIYLAISKPVEKVIQQAYWIADNQKISLVGHILKERNLHSVLIFCSTKLSAKNLSRELIKLKMSVGEIHSDIEQSAREKVLNDFKARNIQILVATDILSRGIDIEDIDMVINFDVPNDGEDYIHRIGRTARAETEGVAVTFINPKEKVKFLKIEALLGKSVPKIPLPEMIGIVKDNQQDKKEFSLKNKKKRYSKPFHRKDPSK